MSARGKQKRRGWFQTKKSPCISDTTLLWLLISANEKSIRESHVPLQTEIILHGGESLAGETGLERNAKWQPIVIENITSP